MFRTHYCYKSLQLHQLPCINENGTHTKKIIASQQFSLKTKYRGITIMGPWGELISNIIFIITTVLCLITLGHFLSQKRANLYVKILTHTQLNDHTVISKNLPFAQVKKHLNKHMWHVDVKWNTAFLKLEQGDVMWTELRIKGTNASLLWSSCIWINSI